jgi:isoleucyl-tRNA synthetase
MESIWWVFKRIWDQRLIYEGFKVMPYCPRCATPLSNFETAQGYQDVQDPAITVRFRIPEDAARGLRAEHPLYFLAWTTTPWTLPSNLALAVGHDIEYARVVDGDEEYILARDRIATYWKDDSSIEVAETFGGGQLDGVRYEPLFPYFAAHTERGAFRALAADFVSTDEGTGIVHVAPGFGEDDHALGQRHGLDVVCPVDAEARFTQEVADFAGRFVKDADADVIRRLKDEGKLVHRGTLQHSYPHCYRCDAPLIYRAITTWFVRIDDIKERMLANNRQIHWVPSHLQEGRFGQWLQNARDWAISRNRYWGTPLPVWRCESCKNDVCVGSVAELQELSGEPVSDLHKHYVDDIAIPCGSCKAPMRRVPEVLDCWFESGSMPYAQNHYPFENKEHFESNFPAEFIAEGIDQTRGWFYTLIVLSSALFDAPAFKNVIVNGLILAADGKKMSKRLKNYPEPDVIIDRYGADALRLYLMNSAVVRGENLRFTEDGVREVLRSIVLPLWNAYSFFVTYANVDRWEPRELQRPAATTRKNMLDRWILSAQQQLLRLVTESMQAYELQRAIEPIVRFIDDLTNWYIRRSRRRFWKSDDDEDKAQAYETLYSVLLDTCHVLAPYTPFVADSMYRNLVSPLRERGLEVADSVHLCDWPQYSAADEDEELDASMELVIRAVSMGRALRTAHSLKVRQPLAAIHLVTRDARARRSLEPFVDQIRDELNVKEVRFDDRESELVDHVVKPNFKSLGPRFGRDVQKVARAVAELPLEEVLAVEDGGEHAMDVDGIRLSLTAEDVIVERREKAGLFAECSGPLTVALDHELTPELVEEGLAREFVNRVQNLRKEAALHVSDRVLVRYHSPAPEVGRAVEHHTETIRSETLAQELVCAAAPPEGVAPTDLNGHVVHISVEKIEASS